MTDKELDNIITKHVSIKWEVRAIVCAIVFLLIVLFFAIPAKGEEIVIKDKDYRIVGTIDSETGIIKDTNRNIIGRIEKDGTVKDSKQNITGRIEGNNKSKKK